MTGWTVSTVETWCQQLVRTAPSSQWTGLGHNNGLLLPVSTTGDGQVRGTPKYIFEDDSDREKFCVFVKCVDTQIFMYLQYPKMYIFSL